MIEKITKLLVSVGIVFFAGGASIFKQECHGEKLLVFYAETAGWFTHPSIAAGRTMFKNMGLNNNFTIDESVNPAVFTSENLKQYDAIVFLNSNGDFFNDSQKLAFQNFIRSGKGWMGTHCADNTLNEWNWYHEMIGSTYRGDSWDDNLPLIILDTISPGTKDLPNPWIVKQQYRKNTWAFNATTPSFKVLIKVDPAFYEGHIGPSAWSNQTYVPYVYTHEFEGGRAWYGGMGHTDETFSNENWKKIILDGVRYAFGKKTTALEKPAGKPVSYAPRSMHAGESMYSITGRRIFPRVKAGRCLAPGLYLVNDNGTFRPRAVMP